MNAGGNNLSNKTYGLTQIDDFVQLTSDLFV